jgi:hypothetical protein
MCLTNMREAAFKMIKLAKERGCVVMISSSDSSDHYEQYLNEGADFILLGEAEQTLAELSEAITTNKTDFLSIAGLAYKLDNAIIKTVKRNVIKELDSLPFPAWDLVDIEPYRKMWMKHAGYFSLNIATTRGCPFKCNWCAKPIYGNRYNSRSPQNVVDELLELKRKYPAFGPAKLVTMLEEERGEHVLAVSTAGTILSRHGQVKKRGPRQRSVGRIEHSPYEISGAGDSETTDFKGQFRMGNNALCYPLTIADPFSRYVLAIEALESTHMAPAKKVFERVFREHGVPRQLISDNGTPFCSATSLGGLTQLSRWWIEMGVTPIRIRPGRPTRTASMSECIERSKIGSCRTRNRAYAATNEASTRFESSSIRSVRIRAWDKRLRPVPFDPTDRFPRARPRSSTTPTWMYGWSMPTARSNGKVLRFL